MRHCTAACLVAREWDPESSVLVGDIHELWYPAKDPREDRMDQFNNRSGAKFSESDGSSLVLCREAVDGSNLEVMPMHTWVDE